MKQTLFKSFFVLASLLYLHAPSHATMHMITAADFTFTPPSITTVQVGDTIMWMWTSGSSNHNTVSGSIPGGATPWSSALDAGTPMYMYEVTVAGTYNYTCTFHPGMNGSFVATGTTAVKSVTARHFSISPNPVSDVLNIRTDKKINHVQLIDITGRVVKTISPAADNTYPVSDVPKGFYILLITSDNNSIATEKLIVAR